MDRLVLNEFKDLYRGLSKGLPKPLAFLLYGFLVWIQEKYIAAKATAAVDKAIRVYEEQEVKEPSPVEGVYSETGSGFFDEMRIQARYTLTDTDDSK